MIYFINQPITSKAPKNALTKPHKSGILKSAGVKWRNSSKVAPPIIGVDNKKEIRALVLRDKPSRSAAVMVMPLRDTPGISARACAQPIIISVLNKMGVSGFLRPFLSAQPSKQANTIKQTAIISGFLKVFSAKSFSKSPAMAAGTVAAAKYHNLRPSCVVGRVSPSLMRTNQSLAKYKSTASSVAAWSITSNANP